MNKLLFLLSLCVFSGKNIKAQKTDLNEEEILEVVKIFAKSVKDKDSVSYLNLFHHQPIVWEGVNKDKSLNKFREKKPEMNDCFSDNYIEFIRRIVKSGKIFEEKYDNIQIINDDKIATVFFDYTFIIDSDVKNWGSESWQLIKTNGNWKITSIIFSSESNNVVPTPDLKQRKKIRKNLSGS
ncbi:MAG: hypothetical protein QM610_00795 [Chitinophagaceae bacterium]